MRNVILFFLLAGAVFLLAPARNAHADTTQFTCCKAVNIECAPITVTYVATELTRDVFFKADQACAKLQKCSIKPRGAEEYASDVIVCDPSPLAGATPEVLKAQAQSVLNKAKFSGPVDIINRAIKILMAFIGSIALVLYVWSGFLWMTASGNAEQVNKAKTTMVWTTLGVAMMLASYMLASFIFKSLGV